jgi:glycosyltransferase involved in cell wall biosynthesis
MILGIDASSIGSGGAKRHLTEILACFNTTKHGFCRIIIWAPDEFLKLLPDKLFLVKQSHPLLNKSFLYRSIWQLFYSDRAFKAMNINVLFSPFGTYIGNFKNFVSMSQNMLVFDKIERKRFGFTLSHFKFILLFHIQRLSFNKSLGIIFISEYAKNSISKFVDYSTHKTAIIHHGISKTFLAEPLKQFSISFYNTDNPFQFLYISSVFNYKHQLQVIEAIYRLREKGYPIVITLVGEVGQKKTGQLLQKKISLLDPENFFIFWHKNVDLNGVVNYYHSSNAFIFASTCENMPNILIEAMASGLPIACSISNPMPEFLENSGVYFNPENIDEIENVLEKLLNNENQRTEISNLAFANSKKYNWRRCADETFNFLYTLC